MTRQSIDALRKEVLTGFGPAADRVIPDVRELAADFAYGMVWSRPGLSTRDRSIATIAALVTLGSAHHLQLHVLRGMTNGLSKAEVGEIVTQLIPYIGFPRSVSASTVLADLLDRLPPDPDAACDQDDAK